MDSGLRAKHAHLEKADMDEEREARGGVVWCGDFQSLSHCMDMDMDTHCIAFVAFFPPSVCGVSVRFSSCR